MRIDIDENRVRLSSLTGAKISQVDTTRFARAFIGTERPPTGIFSPAVRWISRAGSAVIVERPPAKMAITYTDLSNGESQEFLIPVPWQVYAVKWNDASLERVHMVKAYARPNQIYSASDPLFRLWLPNLFNDESLCMPKNDFHAGYEVYRNQRIYDYGSCDLARATNFVINAIWQSPFNSDYEVTIHERVPHEIDGVDSDESFADNHLATLDWLQAQPLPEVLTWDLVKPGELGDQTVKELMERFEDEPEDNYESTMALLLATMRKAEAIPT